MKLKNFAAWAALALLAACGKDPSAGNENTVDPAEPREPIPAPALGYDVAPYGWDVCTDASFELTFSAAPSLGTSGSIRICKENGTVADEIAVADISDTEEKLTNTTLFSTAYNALKCAGNYRIVKYDPIVIEGNKLTVNLHSAKLSHDTRYYIEIDAEAIVAEGFSGITEEDGWVFVTKAKPASKSVLTVSKDGNSDFNTVQGAITYAYTIGQTAEVTIEIADGVYEELLFMRDKYNITLKGESREGTIIRGRNSEALSYGSGQSVTSVPGSGASVGRSGGRSVFLIEGGDKIRFESLTLENTYGDGAQAEALYFNSDSGRLVFVDCDIISEQDTFCLKGWGWFYNCSITGDVDFIWGYPKAVLFEECDIISCSSKGYIVQCRCQEASYRGFVFLNCHIKPGDASVTQTYLGRSGGDSSVYDNVSYINCTMENHIVSAGWHTSKAPTPTTPTVLRGWKEYGTRNASGATIDLSVRSGYSKILTEAEFNEYYKDRALILSGAPDGSSWAAL